MSFEKYQHQKKNGQEQSSPERVRPPVRSAQIQYEKSEGTQTPHKSKERRKEKEFDAFWYLKRVELNHYHADADTGKSRDAKKCKQLFFHVIARATGFEPAIFSVTGRRVRPGYTTPAFYLKILTRFWVN